MPVSGHSFQQFLRQVAAPCQGGPHVRLGVAQQQREAFRVERAALGGGTARNGIGRLQIVGRSQRGARHARRAAPVARGRRIGLFLQDTLHAAALGVMQQPGRQESQSHHYGVRIRAEAQHPAQARPQQPESQLRRGKGGDEIDRQYGQQAPADVAAGDTEHEDDVGQADRGGDGQRGDDAGREGPGVGLPVGRGGRACHGD
jgi:hypothetical protein